MSATIAWYDPVVCFGVYSLLGILFYWLVPAPHAKDRDSAQYYAYYSSHVSLVHCLVSVVFCKGLAIKVVVLKMCLYGWDFCGPNKPLYYVISLVCPSYSSQHSLGYFLFDLLYGEIFQCSTNIFRVHHIISVYGLFTALTSTYSMSELISISSSHLLAGIFLCELSNPFLQTSLLLSARGITTGKLAGTFHALLVITWIVCR